MLYQLEIYYAGKWRRLFCGELAELKEYTRRCGDGAELRIVPAERGR